MILVCIGLCSLFGGIFMNLFIGVAYALEIISNLLLNVVMNTILISSVMIFKILGCDVSETTVFSYFSYSVDN